MFLPYEQAFKTAMGGENYESETLRFLASTETTIGDIAAAIAEGKPAGFSIFALEQTKGRGGGVDKATGQVRQWFSAPGNLMLSYVIDADMDYPKEVEFTDMLAVGEIVAALVPRGRTVYKFANDILVDDCKIAGGLYLPHPFPSRAAPLASMSVGLNIVTPPPADAMRDKSVAVAGTCFADHGVDIDIPRFMRLFDAKRDELGRVHRQQGFTAILQRIGFADSAGLVTLYGRDGAPVCGYYAGFDAQQIRPDTYANFIRLRMDDGNIKALAFTDYCAAAVIRPMAAVGCYAPRPPDRGPHA